MADFTPEARAIVDQHGAAVRDAYAVHCIDYPDVAALTPTERAKVGLWLSWVMGDIDAVLRDGNTDPWVDVRARLIAWVSVFSDAGAAEAGL